MSGRQALLDSCLLLPCPTLVPAGGRSPDPSCARLGAAKCHGSDMPAPC